MIDKPDILTMASSLAGYAAARQSVIAGNIANADTPGYRARDLPAFDRIYDDAATQPMRATRAAHLDAGSRSAELRPVAVSGHAEPNGNSVSLETQMVASAEAQRDHDLAVAVMRSTLAILRGSLGRR